MHHASPSRGEHTSLLPPASLGLRTTRSTNEIRADWPEGANNPHPRAIEMADAMRETASSAGGVTTGDLVGRGFTMAEITEHEPEARKIADAIIVRQVKPWGDRVPDIIQKAIDSIASRMPVASNNQPDEPEHKALRAAWDRFCTARAAFKLDPWISQSERCVHLMSNFLTLTPLLVKERNRVIYALAADQKATLHRRAG